MDVIGNPYVTVSVFDSNGSTVQTGQVSSGVIDELYFEGNDLASVHVDGVSILDYVCIIANG